MENTNDIVSNIQPPFEVSSGGSLDKETLTSYQKKIYDNALAYATKNNDPSPKDFALNAATKTQISYGKNNPFGDLATKSQPGTIKNGIKYRDYPTVEVPLSKQYEQHIQELNNQQLAQEQEIAEQEEEMYNAEQEVQQQDVFQEQLQQEPQQYQQPQNNIQFQPQQAPSVYDRNYSDQQVQNNNSTEQLDVMNPIQQMAMGGEIDLFKKKNTSVDLDKYLKSSFKQELEKQKQDESNFFKSPISNRYKKQLRERINNTPQLKQDNSTEKNREFNKNYHDKKEWNAKKWGIYENIATTAELGNFGPHPLAQIVGKAGSIASAALSARKAKLAYDNEDYVNMGLNLGMMGLSGKMGSATFAKNTVKNKNLDSFEKLIAPKEFKSNIVNGYEIGRMETKVPSYINVLNKKPGQNTLGLAKNRALLGVAGVDYFTDFNTKQNQKAYGGYTNKSYEGGGHLNSYDTGGLHEENPNGGIPQGIGQNGHLNTTEQDETSFNVNGKKFIFSNRIMTDGSIRNHSLNKKNG